MTALQRYQMFIDGKWTDASDMRSFTSMNPATGEDWSEIPEATAADVNRAVEAAHRAFTSGEWAAALPTARGKYLRRLAELLAQKSEELGRTETIDTGKMLKETRWQAKYTFREPLGVVAAVVPWNSQLFLVAVKIGPALAAGNTVVLKASEHASAPMLDFARLVEEAGFPPGVFNVVTGHGDPCGRVLTSHPLVQRISFTGGPESARNIIRNSAENFAQVSLELGGKSPFIVFDDADLESAVNGSISGIFGATGQSCVAGSRLYLQDSVADKFLDMIVTRARQIRNGDPLLEETQMGPLATKGQLSRIEKEVVFAQEQGGRLLTGGQRPPGLSHGLFYEPTIIECRSQQDRIVDTELFGPVLSVQRFKSEDEVIQLANDTKHGLAAGVFTKNGARALRVTKQLRAGIVWVNTYRVVSPIAEFGGFKESGYGRESGFQAIYDYTRPKTVWINTSDQPLANPFVMR